MRFTYDLTIPAATLEVAPAERTIQLVPGRITRILASFRKGPHNLVYVRIRQGLYRVFPVADSDAIFGDDMTHDVPMDLELAPPAPELVLQGWAPDTRYSHKVSFAFDITPSGGDEREALLSMIFGSAAGGSA